MKEGNRGPHMRYLRTLKVEEMTELSNSGHEYAFDSNDDVDVFFRVPNTLNVKIDILPIFKVVEQQKRLFFLVLTHTIRINIQ